MPEYNVTTDSHSRRERAQTKQEIPSNQRTVDLSVIQPLYSGGRTQAETKRAEALVQAQRADLLSTEQTVLLDGSTAYLDVVRDQAVLDLNINNEQVLRRQLQASRDRFKVGEITRTDVSQAEVPAGTRHIRQDPVGRSAQRQPSGLCPRDRYASGPADGATAGFRPSRLTGRDRVIGGE